MCFCMYLGDGLFNTVDGSEIPRPDGGTSPGDGGKSPGMVVKPCR